MATITDTGASAAGNRWLVRYREPGGRTGRQRQKSFARKKDAVDFATKVENDKREHTYVDPTAGRTSVRSYTAQWLTLDGRAPSTQAAYESIFRCHVLPHLGDKTMSQVTASDIEALYAAWRRGGAAPMTVTNRAIPLAAMFAHAVRHKRISHSPVKDAKKPLTSITPVDERQLPSTEEIAALAKSIGERLEPAVWLMACAGLRISESLGVFPEDIQDGVLRVRRQVVRIREESGKYSAVYAPLKHRREGQWRDVPIPSFLDEFTHRLPILNEHGGIPHGGLVRKSWYRAIERLDMPRYKPHDLRHKWATVVLTQGASLHETARWMGHTAISVTAATYGHLTQDGWERCQQILSAAYGPYAPGHTTNPC
ncbi:tyrosine-type recombinase/integrase [Streptomyces sp. SID8379]|uniref:tyrosine-type recombinase/integrase n=1 Tax=unclassified Streptomyces TaxID=2593676 RepID=UPI00131A4771|nr:MULTISPECIES: site-specific integrase [unclassified Streptomyces]MYW70428.1 tyrosine-type recombinase/integrase [Streptomyces sp. SID8379]